MNTCPLCSGTERPLIERIEDFEYGVAWRSALWQCRSCSLVIQEPRVRPEQVPALYPADYLAYGGGSRGRGVYGRLKEILARREASVVARHVPDGGSVLDVGCGAGKFLAVLHRLRPDLALAGVDIEDCGIGGLPGLTFHQGQLEELALPPGSFDAVYCSNLIEHVPDPLAFLSAVREVLKPGGVLVGITPDHRSLDRYLFGRFWAGYHYPRHTFVFDHRNIRLALERAGLEVARVDGSHAYWYLSLANLLLHQPGRRPRGLAFAAVTALFAPLDLLVNLVRTHGSMTFVAQRSPAEA
ncbi:MAG: class I SAM-dependent methyltransferase [Geminicoccaceae bacterium]|nr:class I SAM-dependent methyltransferase [Geminicoccaceae bacterium]